jgi:dCMP deaminase
MEEGIVPNKKELDDTYMGTAILHSKLSKAMRSKVGACLVTQDGVTLTGYNGTPTGMDNVCETEINHGFNPLINNNDIELVTKPEVLHAELNCILKAAREGVSCKNATVYVTMSPCVQCAAMMVNIGIKRLVYKEQYRDTAGINLLLKAGINAEQYYF